jgi:hypothetical protein
MTKELKQTKRQPGVEMSAEAVLTEAHPHCEKRERAHGVGEPDDQLAGQSGERNPERLPKGAELFRPRQS